MDQIDSAIANAITFECKKDGLSQRQSGDWQLRVVVQAIEMDQRIVGAPMGTRFQVVMVEIGDDEQPVDHKAMDRDKWRALGPVKQAGIRCKDAVFQAYLREALHFPVKDEESAARAVRDICRVLTRSEFTTNSDARILWFALDTHFQGWKAKENA